VRNGELFSESYCALAARSIMEGAESSVGENSRSSSSVSHGTPVAVVFEDTRLTTSPLTCGGGGAASSSAALVVCLCAINAAVDARNAFFLGAAAATTPPVLR
jgi:hypothetical protein